MLRAPPAASMSDDEWYAMALDQEELDSQDSGFSEYAKVWSGASNVLPAGRQASPVTPGQAASSSDVGCLSRCCYRSCLRSRSVVCVRSSRLRMCFRLLPRPRRRLRPVAVRCCPFSSNVLLLQVLTTWLGNSCGICAGQTQSSSQMSTGGRHCR